MSKLSDEEFRQLRARQQAEREAERATWTPRERELWDQLEEAGALIVQAQDALTTAHPVWWLLDDYDGSGDSVKRMREYVQRSQDLIADMYKIIGDTPTSGTRQGVEHCVRAMNTMDEVDRFQEWWNRKGGYIPTGKEDDSDPQ